MSKTLDVIEARLQQYQGTGFRKHLGASLIGRPCPRQLWYVFRWVKKARHRARLLRLFSRGDREEAYLVKLMRQAGIHVLDRDPETGLQFRVGDHDEHFGGSLDAKIFDAPDFPGIWALGEFKTYNDNQFKKLRKEGLKKAKPEYFAQAQIYMHYEELPVCIHFNVNKNDDDIHVLTVEYAAEEAEKYIDKAGRIIYSPTPPPRPDNASPGWYMCRYCDFSDICHHHAPKEKNCRTCVHSDPVEEGQWLCQKFQVILSEGAQKLGCLEHRDIPED